MSYPSIQEKRASITRQMAVRERDLASARNAHADACLALADADTPANRQAVTVLEAEIAEHEQALNRFKVAQQALTEGAVLKAQGDSLEQAKAAVKAAKAAAPRIRVTLERLIAAFEDVIAPGLAELDALRREQSAQAWAAIAATTDRRDLERTASRVRSMTDDSAAVAALLSAALRSGLGQVGPSLAPWLVISAPFQGISTPDKALESFDNQAKKLDAFLADAIERAANPQPATTEE